MPLMLALWAVAFLALISTALLNTSTTSQKLTRNGLQSAQMEAAAEATVARAILGLSEPNPTLRWRANMTGRRFKFHGMTATIAIADEVGRIDLNVADRDLLFRLFQSAGAAPEAANKIADAILAQRMIPPQSGSANAGPDNLRTHKFRSVDEVLLIEGVTAELFKKVAPALTVYSQRRMIDPNFAPPEALHALPGMTKDAIQQLLQQRASQTTTDALAPDLKGKTYRLHIDIEQTSRTHGYEAVIRYTDDPPHFYWVLDWRDAEIE